jgi:alpha-ketoglutarate-dependent taurine dioxygenase
MAGITVAPIEGSTLGAVVTDVRLADLDEPTWQAVLDAFHEHAVLVFPGQHLTDEEQKGFGARFGPLEDINGFKGLTPIANVGRDGQVLDPDGPIMGIIRGNEGWHTDSSYMPVAAKASMLSAHVLPSSGGTTEWADMRAAYDALDDDTKARIESLAAHHSYEYSQRRAGFTNTPEGAYGFHGGPAPLRPLVKVHPVTGRKALFIGRHACDIPGMDPEDSERLLDALLDAATRPPRTYEHHWQVGDLVLWDNRCVLHRARPWPLEEVRVMKHTRVSGDPATESALADGQAQAMISPTA